ncbi:hypothetical protein MRX96_002337 [Rhipicephalus microplus]
MAWDRVTPTTVANCFGKCGLFGSPEGMPPEPEDPTIEDWEQLNVECTSDDFCTADDNLATCGARTVDDIVEEATWEAADSSDDGDDIDVGDGEESPPAVETLHALDVLRRAVAADEVSDDTCTCFYAFEQSLPGEKPWVFLLTYRECTKFHYGHGRCGEGVFRVCSQQQQSAEFFWKRWGRVFKSAPDSCISQSHPAGPEL